VDNEASMWKVLFTEKCEKEIRGLLKSGLLSEDDRRVLSIWIKQVKKHGPDSLREGSHLNNWNDHDLDRKWSGYRASSYSFSGRIIYKVENEVITVKVVRITPEHDYS
jgi:mRNA-degrading endonuclease YafQ of YafQ-DinJ toxin-antitoxin module